MAVIVCDLSYLVITASARRNVFQQDGAPVHLVLEAVDLLKAEIPDLFRPQALWSPSGL